MESMEDFPVVDADDVQVKEKGGQASRRMRIFDEKMRTLCWQKADVVPGRDPERWRKDTAGNVVCRRLTRCDGCLCHQYDHIQPFSKGLYRWLLCASNLFVALCQKMKPAKLLSFLQHSVYLFFPVSSRWTAFKARTVAFS